MMGVSQQAAETQRQQAARSPWCSILQLPDPHIAEADGVAVILESDRKLVRVGLVFGRGVLAHPTRAAAEDGVVLN